MNEEKGLFVTDAQFNRLVQLSKQFENIVKEITPVGVESSKMGYCALPVCGKAFPRSMVTKLFCSLECQKRFNNLKKSKRTEQLGIGGAETEMTKKCNYVPCGSLYAYTKKDIQETPAWYLCPACRTLHPDWLKAHPEWQTPAQVMEEARGLVQGSDKTEEDDTKDIYGNPLPPTNENPPPQGGK